MEINMMVTGSDLRGSKRVRDPWVDHMVTDI